MLRIALDTVARDGYTNHKLQTGKANLGAKPQLEVNMPDLYVSNYIAMGMLSHADELPRTLIPLTAQEAREAAHQPRYRLVSIVNSFPLARVYSTILNLPITSLREKAMVDIGPKDYLLIGNYRGPKIEKYHPLPKINWWLLAPNQ